MTRKVQVFIDVSELLNQRFIGGIQQVFWNLFDASLDFRFVSVSQGVVSEIPRAKILEHRAVLSKKKTRLRLIFGSFYFALLRLQALSALLSAFRRRERSHQAIPNDKIFCVFHGNVGCEQYDVRLVTFDTPSRTIANAKSAGFGGCHANLETVSYYHDSMPLTRPDLLDSHDCEIESIQKAYRDRLEVLSNYDFVVPNSSFTASELRDLGNELKIDLRITEPAPPFDYSQVRGLQVRAPQSGEAIRVLCIGPWDQRKNFGLAFRALSSFIQRKNVEVCITAVRPRSVLRDVETLKAAKELRGLTQMVVRDYETPSGLATLFETSHVVLISSQYEGYGLPAAMARAAGCYLIATNTTALPEVVQALGYGSESLAGDEEEWLSALESWYSSSQDHVGPTLSVSSPSLHSEWFGQLLQRQSLAK